MYMGATSGSPRSTSPSPSPFPSSPSSSPSTTADAGLPVMVGVWGLEGRVGGAGLFPAVSSSSPDSESSVSDASRSMYSPEGGGGAAG